MRFLIVAVKAFEDRRAPREFVGHRTAKKLQFLNLQSSSKSTCPLVSFGGFSPSERTLKCNQVNEHSDKSPKALATELADDEC